MRKVSSTSNIFETPKSLVNYSSTFSRPVSGLNHNSLFTQRIRQSSKKYSRHLKSTRSSLNSSASFMSIVSSISKEVLYEETLSLKHEVNKLVNQISLIKSGSRKKEVDLFLKEKMIEDANINAIENQDKFDQLIDSNSISKIKKAFAQLKAAYQNQKDSNSKARNSIRNSKANDVKLKIKHMESSLSDLIDKYSVMQLDNNDLANELSESTMLSIVFSNQHQIISSHQMELDEVKGRVEALQIKINAKNEEMSKNESTKKRLNIEMTNLIRNKQKLINEKSNHEEFCKSKPLLLSKIKALEEKVKYYKEECKNKETMIKTLQEDTTKLEKEKGKDKTKLKPVDYHSFKVIEADPIFYSNSKVLLLKSLINESKQQQKKYHLKIQASIQLLQEFGKTVSSIEEINNELDQIVIGSKGIKSQDIVHDDNKDAKNGFDQENGQVVELKPSPSSSSEVNAKMKDINVNISSTTPLPNNNDTKDTSLHQIDQQQQQQQQNQQLQQENQQHQGKQISNELFTEITYVIVKNIEAKRFTSGTAEEIILNKIKESNPLISKDNYLNQIFSNIQDAIGCQNENDKNTIRMWLDSLFCIYHDDIAKVTNSFSTLFSNIREYTEEEDLILSKKIKKALLPYKDKLKEKFILNKNGKVSYLLLKHFIEEEKIEMKDSYGEFLFYKLKQFKPIGQVSLYDLDLELLFDIFNNNLNDSKMNAKTENDIEISQEDYVRIITQFALALRNYLTAHNITLKKLLGTSIQKIESGTHEPGFDVINIEVFVEEMKKIPLDINTELEIYCLFNRYKISDDYEYLSVDLIENDLGGKNKYEATSKQVMENVPEEEEESNENKIE